MSFSLLAQESVKDVGGGREENGFPVLPAGSLPVLQVQRA